MMMINLMVMMMTVVVVTIYERDLNPDAKKNQKEKNPVYEVFLNPISEKVPTRSR